MHHAAIHPLTPGSPAYAVLKLSAVGGVIALRMLLSRRDKAEREQEPVQERPARPHPVSRRKARRRRRRGSNG